MTETCPFCGMREDIFSYNPEDYCRWVGKYADDFKGLRSVSCYERQLAQQAEVMRETLGVIRKSIVNLPDHKDKWPCHCRTCVVGAYLNTVVPKLEAMVEEKS